MENKTIFSTIFLFSITYFSFAQTKDGNDFGLSIAMNSIQAQVEIPLMTGTGIVVVDADGNILTGGNRVDKSYSYSIIPKYHINNGIALRFEFGVTNLNLSSSSDSKYYSTHAISNTEVKSKIFRYTPGFQWTFMKTKRLESYCGMTVSYINYQKLNINAYYEHRNLPTDTITDWEKSMATTPGGFAVGFGAFAGFNIYLHKHISLGAELSSSALYYKLAGTTTEESSGQVPPNPLSPTVTSTYSNSYKGFKISKIISSFNISFWF